MIKHLTRHGNSYALVIDRGILNLLEIDDKTPLSIMTDGQNLYVSPVRNRALRRKFQDALADGNRRYGRMLKKLAE